jgi:hypothetical protein
MEIGGRRYDYIGEQSKDKSRLPCHAMISKQIRNVGLLFSSKSLFWEDEQLKL